MNRHPVEPLRATHRGVEDANGDVVMVCSDDREPCELFTGSWIDVPANYYYCCPKCGRPSFRMEEMTVDQLFRHASMDVGELLQWIEIHAGTDREVWQWWPGGLLCCVNGLACEVRYRTERNG